MASRAESNTAHMPSPVCLNTVPRWASTAERRTASWTTRAARIEAASDSHIRVDPWMSVKRKVTVRAG